jgi:hypothetical protein
MQDRDEEAAAALQDADQLLHTWAKIREVSERQTADHQVEACVCRWDSAQIAVEEARSRNIACCPLQHLWRQIDAKNVMAEFGEMLGVPACGARGVERVAGRK